VTGLLAEAAAPLLPEAVGAPTWPVVGARVVHVPDHHAYVEHVSRAAPPGVPLGAMGTPAGRAEARCRFTWDDDPGWVRRHGDDFDVMHVHFGFEQYPLPRLRQLLDELEAVGRPLVWTAHDLSNPHLSDQRPHEAQLELLAERAAAVLTLTPGAAEEIQHRWGRRAVVVSHPHLAPPAVMALGRPSPEGTAVVGLPLGMLRPNTDRRVVLGLLQVLPDLSGVLLRAQLREEVLAAGFPRPDQALVDALRAASRDGLVDLRVGGRSDEDRLHAELRELSALVLPYRWGSHSGWVESCHDVGTPVVAPALGHWGEQHPLHLFDVGPAGPDRDGLASAVRAAVDAGPRPTSVLRERLAERADGVRQHDRIHARVATGARL